MSVPSIFSQLFEQAEAFSKVNHLDQIADSHMGIEVERNVSHVLDLFELIFMYGSDVEVTRIDLNELPRLTHFSHSRHGLLVSVILEDIQSCGLHGVADLFLFSWRDFVYGGTSPLTVVYTSPSLMHNSLLENVTVVGTSGNKLFQNVVPLHRRGMAFRRFMYEYNETYHLPRCLHDYIENAMQEENIPIDMVHPMPVGIDSRYQVLRDSSGVPVVVNGIPILFMPLEVSHVNDESARSLGCEQTVVQTSNAHLFSKGRIAIARDFAIVLHEDGYLTRINSSGQRYNLGYLSSERDKIVKIAATFRGFIGLTQSGHVVMGEVDENEYRVAETWRNVKDIVGCEGHVLAVLHDGSVVCVDGPGDWTCSPMHKNVVQDWSNIKQVAAGFENVMGLTNEGRVLYYRSHYSDFYNRYLDIVQVDCYNHYYGSVSSMVLHRDGTVSSDTFEGVGSWRDIAHISVGADIAIGLKRDGTIEMVDNWGRDWKQKTGITLLV